MRRCSRSTARRRWPGRRPISTAARHDAAGAAPGVVACRMGNDPHNQEIALCMLEDFGKNREPRPRPPAAGRRPAHRAHRKYGDPLDCSRRFGEALGIAGLQ